MKVIIKILTLILFSGFNLHAQNIELLSLGGGALPVRLKGTTKDDAGNYYHFGDFRGAFSVVNDTLLFGNGGDDLFIYKTNASGNTIWAKNYGESASEAANSKLFYYQDGLYGIFRILSNTKIGDIDVALVNNSSPTNCLIKFDTSGNVAWIIPTNASLSTDIHFYNNKIRLQGSISRVSGAVYIKDSIILPSTGFNNRFFIDISKNGNIEKVFNVFQNNNFNTSFSMHGVGNLHQNQFYLLVQTTNAFIQPGNNKLKVHETEINIPHVLNTILIKTDSNFNVIHHKILNPSGIQQILDLTQDRLSINEKGDSLYLLLNLYSGQYAVDQFSVDISRGRYMASYDTMLITRSVVSLSQPAIQGNEAETNYYRLMHHNGSKYYFGVFRGKNQVKPPTVIPSQLANINLFKDISQPMNLAAPSMSFVVKETPNNVPQIRFLGDHATYEEDYIKMSGFEFTDTDIMFVNTTDDRFNPWRLSTDLAIVTGGMIQLSDKAESISRIQYFDDGSKFMVGSAIGKTIFESNNDTTLSTAKGDLFFAVLRPDNSVKQYHRIFGSFRAINLIKQIKKANKIYLLYSISGARNQPGQNFLSIRGETIMIPGDFSPFFVNAGYKLLFIIDENGNLNYRNLYNLTIGPAKTFDIYENGDLLIASANQTKAIAANGIIFPADEGFFVARINNFSQPIQLVKIFSATNPKPVAEDIHLLPDESNFIISSSTGFTGSTSSQTVQMVFTNGGTGQFQFINQYPGTPSVRGYMGFQRLDFNRIYNSSTLGPMYTNFSQAQIAASHGFYAGFINGAGFTEPLKYNGIEVSASNSPFRSHILKMNHNLQLQEEITFNATGNFSFHEFRPSRLIEKNGAIYITGIQYQTLKFGAVSISHKGEGDGLVIKLDSSLNLLKYFGLQSLNAEQITDIDIFRDSVIAFAAFSLSTPQLIVGPQYVSTSNTLKQEDLGPVHYLGNVPIQNFPADLIFTKQNGDWHDPATWNIGAVPENDARVVIKHKVQIGQATSCKTVFMDATGNIQVASGIVLTITGENNN
jgi:hypothetical protein